MFRVTVTSAHLGVGLVPVPTSQTEEAHGSQGTR